MFSACINFCEIFSNLFSKLNSLFLFICPFLDNLSISVCVLKSVMMFMFFKTTSEMRSSHFSVILNIIIIFFHFNHVQLQCLKKCPGNYLQALKAIPRTLRMMWVNYPPMSIWFQHTHWYTGQHAFPKTREKWNVHSNFGTLQCFAAVTFRYVHSYQSFLWNHAASARVQKHGMLLYFVLLNFTSLQKFIHCLNV